MQASKQGNQLYGVKPEMVLVHCVVASVFAHHGVSCTLTSVVGRSHGDRSLHPAGYAIDYRSKHIAHNDIKLAILDHLKQALPQCDILLEDLGGEQEHYHIEFDPKDDPKYQADKAIYKQTGEWPCGAS